MPRFSILLTAAACLVGGCQHPSSSPASAPPEGASAASAVAAATVETAPAAARHPILVLHEFNPWGSVIGAEIPSFVLYDDGLLIYLEEQQRGARVLEAELSAEQSQLLTRRVFDALEGVPRDVQLSQWTDQPTVRLMAQIDGKWRVSYIYGLGEDGKPSTELAHGAQPLSPELAQTYRDLRGYTAADGRKWQPERLEVMLGGFEYAKDVVAWPADIPTPPTDFVPNKEHRVRRYDIPAIHGEALQRLIASLGDRKAVSWNGHSWSVSVRPVIPAQDEIHAAAR